jgi:6-phospho-beta-glucosidase
MQEVKIVVLGGSGVATPLLISALAGVPGRTRHIEVVLVGRTAGKLELVAAVSRMIAASDPLLRVTAQTDPETALAGAHIVLNQVRVGGLEARVFDETFPHEIGLAGEETVGPGGFANASRTIPVVLEYARMIERACPDAAVITFSNPSSLVQYALSRYTTLNAIGLCDVPIGMHQQIAKAAGAAPEEVWIDYIGMHHFGWVVNAWKDGKSVLPQVLERAETAAPEMDPEFTRAMGAVPCRYFRYVFQPEKMLALSLNRRPRALELLEMQDQFLAEFERILAAGSLPDGKPPAVLARRNAVWYPAIIVPVLMAMIEKRSQTHIINITNGQAVPWLPEDAIVEVPVLFHRGRPMALAAPPVPNDIRLLVQRNCAFEMLAVEAIVERDRAKALRALLSHPMIRTHEQAAKTLEYAWDKGP